jgi:hypothetical protein
LCNQCGFFGYFQTTQRFLSLPVPATEFCHFANIGSFALLLVVK